jgi:DNA-directed RNA polymerase specialized sigma24 family protein
LNSLSNILTDLAQTVRIPFYVGGLDADTRAFDADLDRTRAYVRSIAMKYVRNEHDAEDVTQDAMLLAHRYRDSFRGESRYSTWLYRVTVNVVLMHRRAAKSRLVFSEAPEHVTAIESRAGAERVASSHDRAAGSPAPTPGVVAKPSRSSARSIQPCSGS